MEGRAFLVTLVPITPPTAASVRVGLYFIFLLLPFLWRNEMNATSLSGVSTGLVVDHQSSFDPGVFWCAIAFCKFAHSLSSSFKLDAVRKDFFSFFASCTLPRFSFRTSAGRPPRPPLSSFVNRFGWDSFPTPRSFQCPWLLALITKTDGELGEEPHCAFFPLRIFVHFALRSLLSEDASCAFISLSLVEISTAPRTQLPPRPEHILSLVSCSSLSKVRRVRGKVLYFCLISPVLELPLRLVVIRSDGFTSPTARCSQKADSSPEAWGRPLPLPPTTRAHMPFEMRPRMDRYAITRSRGSTS